jgi:hypothetical protein
MFLIAFASTPQALHAQIAPPAGTTVAVKMIDTVNSASDPAGRQYRASVTQAVDAGNGVSIAQGAAATVTLISSGSGYTAHLSSITINGQAVAVTSNSASVSAVGQYAQSRAASAVGSMLGGFGHHVSAPASVAAAATGQHVSLPTGTTLTFVLGNSPSSNAASAAPATPAAQSAPVQHTAYAAPAPAAAPAPGHDPYLCMYYGQKDAHQITYVSPMVYTGAPPSQAFFNYLNTNYDLSKIQHAAGHCDRYSSDPATQANSVDMLEKQWAASKTEVIHINWTNSPAENAAATAKLASEATAAAVPTAAANQNYVFCHSAWAPGTKAEAAATVMYVSDIFPADMPPPLTPKPGHPLPANANGAQINRTYALQISFFAFLQKQYGFKDSGNYPTTCATSFPPTAGGLQSAQSNKQTTEDGVRQLSGQVVETGWTTH